MRSLVLTVGLVAIAGAAFAGEPQQSTSTQQQPVVASLQKQAPVKTPQKLSDEQLGKIVAGSAVPFDAYLVTSQGTVMPGNGSICILPSPTVDGTSSAFSGHSGYSAQGYLCQF